MTQPGFVWQPSITYWNRVEPSPRGESLRPGLSAAVRDPLWFLTRQWQLGEFHGEDAASPAYVSLTARSSTFDGWSTAAGPVRPFDGSAPLEAVGESEAATPDLRTAVELGQALQRRLAAAGMSPAVIEAFRQAYPIPVLSELPAADRRDPALVRLLRVCGGRGIEGSAVCAAAREDGTGRPRPGGERAAAVAEGEQPSGSGSSEGSLTYRLQSTVPVNWIPFLPVQIDAERRAVALERAAMQRNVDGVIEAVAPAGRVLRPTGLADPDVYHVREEEVARTGTRVLRGVRRTRWIDGSTHLWTSRRRRAGLGEAASGLRYDIAD